MRVTLLMAITVNGYIAGADDDTEWVKDIEALNVTIADFEICVMGRRTYDECVKYNAFPYKGALNIVMTHDKKLLQQSTKQALFTNNSPDEIISLAKQKKFDRLLIIGGGHINGAFLKAGLIDEIILDIHPMIMSQGIHLFENEFPYVHLQLVSFKQINDGLLQVKYSVKKINDILFMK